ncbi:MAG: PilC/PilY family type IV pilus protein [Rhodocyclaceae bacterium]|nr:PilC/PilY family type IV pilus protein [Rhodocyclaceae bacterium]
MNTLARMLPAPFLATLLAWAVLFATPAVADSTVYTDIPLRTKNRAKPNILMMLDNGDYSYTSYSPDRFVTNLRALSLINDSSSPKKTDVQYYFNCAFGGTCNNNYPSNAYSRGDDDWRFRATDCQASIVSGSQVVTCPTGSSAFNRLYYNPGVTYATPKAVDSTNGNLPLPKDVAANPDNYAWYVTGITKSGGAGTAAAGVQPSTSPLYGCTLGNPSIDGPSPANGTNPWKSKYDGTTINSSGVPLQSRDGQTISAWDTCGWRDGYNPSRGTINLLKNYSTAPYPLDGGMIPPENFPRLLASNLSTSDPTEVVTPDGRVTTLASFAVDTYNQDVDVNATGLCSSGYSLPFVCPAGTMPSATNRINCTGTLASGTAAYNGIYHPIIANDYSATDISRTWTLWYETGCTSGTRGTTQYGPFATGILSTVNGPQTMVSPYYCDLTQVNKITKGTTYYGFNNPCATLNPSSQNIWANPGPADYFDTSGNRYPIVIDGANCNGFVQSGGQANCGHGNNANFQIAWTKAVIQNFAIWHSYYRTRLLAVKTSLANAVDNANLNNNFRVGLASILAGGGTNLLGGSSTVSQNYFSAVADFDKNHKVEWYDRLQRVQTASTGHAYDYVSSLHYAYLWFTGTASDPPVPSGTNPVNGQAYMTQVAANTTANTGADSQYIQYQNSSGSWVSTNRTGPLMYSCQPNVLVFVASGAVAQNSSSAVPGISGSGACRDPYTVGGSNTYSSKASLCDVDAGTVALPGYLSSATAYFPPGCGSTSCQTTGPGFFYDKTACKSNDTGACTGTNIAYNDNAWPAPFKAPSDRHYVDNSATTGTDINQSSMAQLALYYWSRDLNEEFNRQKGASIVPVDYPHTDPTTGSPTGGGKLGVPGFGSDSAYWPHVTTYMVGLGTSGQYDYTSTSTSNPVLKAGSSGHLDWPVPTFDSSASYQTYADDMAHAAAAGHGKFLSAYDSSTLNQAFTTLFTDILQLSGSESAVAVANTQVSQTGTSYAFQSSYNTSGWRGDLVASPIQPTTGIIASYTFDAASCQQPTGSTNAGWSAQCQLRNILCPGYLSGGTCATPGSNNASSRIIATDKGNGSSSPGIPFSYASLSGASLSSQFNVYAGDAANVIDYLRGNSALENCASGATTGYRCRYQNGSTVGYWNPLGDVVDAEAVVIGPPQTSYADTGYAAWKDGKANRTPVVFQGANDGMLHAFLVDNSSGGTPGTENWAYVPGFVQPSLKNIATQTYSHQYYVNATPAFGDVDFNNVGSGSGAGDWHTLLVGGLGKGGRGYYALDVTTPTATSEADAASKVLWTFPNSSSDTTACTSTRSNMGYTYGRPALVKVASGTGIRWVALVSSGYDNGSSTGGDGNGHLYILDAKTGSCIKDIPTTVGTSKAGSSGTPNGLAYIAAQVTDPATDQTVKAVYGGDLLGNVWKFGPSNPSLSMDISTWTVTKFAALKDVNGLVQPVTAEPNIAVIAGTPVVYVGTGQYLGTQDVPTNSNFKLDSNYVAQSIYALADTGTINYASSTARAAMTAINGNYRINGDCTNSDGSLSNNCQFGSQFCTVSTSNNLTRCFDPGLQTTLTAASGAHPWVFDLPAGERVITSPVIVLGALMFTSNQPIADPCQPGGKSYFYMLNYQTGGSVGGSAFVSQNILDPVTGDNVMASRPTIVQLPDGRIVGLVSTSVGATLQINNILSQPARRTSWREVPNY